jgi:sugar lactone lactonase YvrE
MAGVRGWELLRFTPDGKLDRRIEMPVEKPSKIAFGGPNLDIMYVTTIGNVGPDGKGDPAQPHAGCLFAIEAGVQGLPTPPARVSW